MSAIIQVKGISKQFRDLRAVDQLSFTVTEGQVYGFLGQNGAGKSTTIRMLLTLIRPDEGSIELFGMDLYRHRRDILRQVGAIVERPDVYKYLTALENLQLFAAMSGTRVSRQRLLEQLDFVGLAERAHSKVRTFSQGMKQRLGIAVALVHDPRLIILDEPTNGLDPQGIADVRKLILHLCRDLGKTVFVSSHLLSEMELIADSILVIARGKKVAEGSKQELLNPATTTVELVTDDAVAAAAGLAATEWAGSCSTGDSRTLLFEINADRVPDLNTALVRAGIRVFSLRSRHSLEDFFLSLTTE